MAPTRKSQATSTTSRTTATKKAVRKRVTRSIPTPTEDWQFLDTHNRDEDDDEEDDDDDDSRSRAQESVDIEQALDPLRRVAEKVGTEVEMFAVKLDGFLKDLPMLDDKLDAALGLIAEFKHVALDAVQNLTKGHEKEKALQLKREWKERAQLSTTDTNARGLGSWAKTGSLFGRTAEKIKELRQWQQEADIWELFSIIVELHYWSSRATREARDKGRAEELEKLGSSHRYEPECETFKRFLLEDEVARQFAKVKRWLEETVDNQESDLSDIIEELKVRGGGLWSQGWTHTRERIKGEKRLRSWPNGSDPIQPQLRSVDNAELLVTQLDPDAPSRLERKLEKSDAISERYMWVACWELLRRGRPTEEVGTWCEERSEGWRAMVFGMAGDQSDALSNSTWRRMCFLASQSGCSNDYEAAVYGLLGGNTAAVRKVARTFDDQLYAYYNAALLSRFDLYLRQNCPEKVSSLAQNGAFAEEADDLDQTDDAVSRLVRHLQTQSSVSHEAAQPMKLIQGYLLTNSAESMVHTIGHNLSDLDKCRPGEAEMIVRFLDDPPFLERDEADGQAAVNPQALRIITHIGIILQAAFSDTPLEGDERDAEENVTVAYMQTLRVAGKRDLIPLYATRLHRARAIRTMGRIVRDVGKHREQEDLLALMKGYGLDIVKIVQEQMTLSLGELLGQVLASKGNLPVKILEDTSDDEYIYPGHRIAVDFLPENMTAEDVALVQSLNWFLLMEGNWRDTFEALAMALRKCLISGRFGCALEIMRTFPYDNISSKKSYESIGRSLNLMESGLPWPVDNEKDALGLDRMKTESRTYYELEVLVRSVEALSKWVTQERKYTTQRPTPTAVPMPVKQAKEDLDAAMEPLLNGILLNPLDDAEETDLNFIRSAYIPEILIAYNSALYTAGNIYTRACLLESMELSITIAKEENGLADCLTRAGRMREMMTSFARTSKSMLVLAASNKKPWKPKKDREGKHPSLWEIGSPAVAMQNGQAELEDS